jgi:WD40 repeat protein
LSDLDFSILVFDVETGAEELRMAGHMGMVWAGTFSPVGRLLATAGSDRVVRVWDTVRGVEAYQLPGQLSYLHFPQKKGKN